MGPVGCATCPENAETDKNVRTNPAFNYAGERLLLKGEFDDVTHIDS